MGQSRFYKFDNIRFLLILCVVFGHLLETIPGVVPLYLYRVIYSFHMPAFLFLSGYFAKYNRRKILFTFLYTYLLFQTIYQLFERFILNPQQEFRFQYTYPYWLLWYLVVMIFYYLLIPIFDSKKRYVQMSFIISSIILSVLAGFDWTIQYYLSLSKFITFLPYFLAGYYIGHYSKIPLMLEEKTQLSYWFAWISLGIVCICCIYLWKNPVIIPAILHGSNNYKLEGYEPTIKIILLIIGACWIMFLLMIPFFDKRIPIVTTIGQNTFSIFLLHGFCVKLVRKYQIFHFSPKINMLLAFQITVVILGLFGNRYIGKIFQRIFTGNWILEIAKKLRKI